MINSKKRFETLDCREQDDLLWISNVLFNKVLNK